MTRVKMDIVKLEKMYDERDDLECAISLLRKASTCISKDLESVQSDLAWVIDAIEEELSLLDDSISAQTKAAQRKGDSECE